MSAALNPQIRIATDIFTQRLWLWLVRCGLYAVACTLWLVSCGLFALACTLWLVRCGL